MKTTIKILVLVFVVVLLIAACSGGINDAETSDATAVEAATAEASPVVNAKPGAAGLGDPYFPEEGNGGYDVQHYDIELSADMEAQEIAAIVTIDAVATQDLSTFNLDFEQLEIAGVLVNGETAEFQHEGDELTIIPLEPIPTGEAFATQISYGGQPGPTNDDGDDIMVGWFWREDAAYVISEPFGAQTWYPVNDSPLDKATYTFRITAPKPLVVAANGLLKETIDDGDSTTYVWEASDPMASYLATVSIDDFAIQTDDSISGLPIINYFPTERAEALTKVFEPTAEMITFLSDRFGPYPFETYGAIVLDGARSFALETQTRPTYAANLAQETVIVHELAHQWFGNSVSLEEWGDMWLKEGFATYAEWLWLEHTKGQETAAELIARKHKTMSAASGSDSYVQPGRPSIDRLYMPNIYDGGATVLHALRLHVGDEAFFNILQTYSERFHDSNAGTADFIAVAEEVSEQELTDFFDGWLYSNDVPELEVN